ncbi:amidohydrolase, partial [Paenibacillus riograndensis]
MPIIDIHIHLSDIDSFHRTASDQSKVDYTAAGLKAEFDQNDVILRIGMGVTEEKKGAFPDSCSPHPMVLDLEDDVPPFLMECCCLNPHRLYGDKLQAALDTIAALMRA